MNIKKITNNLFTYELIGLEVYIVYDGLSGILRTLNREDGSILDTRELQHGIDFNNFKLIAKEMHINIIDTFQEGCAISQRDINAFFAKN